jgi:hypothetical protein
MLGMGTGFQVSEEIGANFYATLKTVIPAEAGTHTTFESCCSISTC